MALAAAEGAEPIAPDFVVAGHPRSGSGSVDAFLAAHPDIHVARKELHYYGADLAYNEPARSPEDYARRLTGGRPGQRVGESSTWYLLLGDGCRGTRYQLEFGPRDPAPA